MIKSWKEYQLNQECGLVFDEKHIKKNYALWPPTDVMQLGNFFQYLCFGLLPKDGRQPDAKWMKSATPDQKSDPAANLDKMLAPYRQAYNQAVKLKMYLKKMGAKVTEVGKWLENGSLTADTDLTMTFPWEQDPVTVDLKYTGMIQDKWSRFGWVLERDDQRDYQGIQARHYSVVCKRPFYYLLVSSTSDDIELIRCEFEDWDLKQYEQAAKGVLEAILLEKEIGFRPVPSFARCMHCPLFDGCNHRKYYPDVRVVNFSEES